MNFCSACGRDFASVKAYDRHRVGDYPQAGPADWNDRISAGLIERGEWEPSLGRRCLDEDELVAVGMEIDGHGRWRLMLTDQDRARLARSRTVVRAAADDSEPLRGAKP